MKSIKNAITSGVVGILVGLIAAQALPKKPKSIHEILEEVFENGKSFSDGWRSCSDSYKIHWEKGRGWICGINAGFDVNTELHEIIVPRETYAELKSAHRSRK